MEPLVRGSAARHNRPARTPHLTARDIEIVRWVTRHGVVNAELIGRRFFWRPSLHTFGRRAAYRRLKALCRLGLILDKREYGTPHNIIRATRAGAKVADIGIRPAPFVIGELRHTLAVVGLVEYLLFEHPGATLTTEREIRAERRRETLAGTRAHGVGRIPDAVLSFPLDENGKRLTVAVELDLTRKDRRTVEHIIRQYAYEKFDRVWWCVTPERVERTQKIVRALGAGDRIEVRSWHA